MVMSFIEDLSPTTRTVLRVTAGLIGGLAMGFATLFLLFVGIVTITGCFIGCGTPNVPGGALLLAGAVAAATISVTSIFWGVTGWGRQLLLKVAGISAALSSVAVLLIAGSG